MTTALPFVLVPRCVPWDLFRTYLETIRVQFPGRRLVVVENNPTNLKRHPPDISLIWYNGERFLAEQMWLGLSGHLGSASSTSIVLPITNHDGRGFEELFAFAEKAAPIPAYVIGPEGGVVPVCQRPSSLRDVGGADSGSNSAGDGAEAGLDYVYTCLDRGLYVAGWWTGHDDTGQSAGTDGDPAASVIDVPRFEQPPHGAGTSTASRFVAVIEPGVPDAKHINVVRASGTWDALLRGFPVDTNGLASLLAKYGECCETPGLSAEDKRQLDTLFGRVIGDFNRQLVASARIVEDLQFGKRPSRPDVCIVIPVFKRYDLVRHLLSSVAKDPFVARQEIVLVLHSVDLPGAEHAPGRCKVLVERVSRLEGLGVRLLVTNVNCGFSTACNFGVRVGTAPYLLLLNSDVIAGQHGWLDKMIAALTSEPGIGAVGALLRYPEGTIQHAGMSWRSEPIVDGAWINTHPFKGMHPSLLRLPPVTDVPAVTGACLLTRMQAFRDLGMLDQGFVQGDYEDSDLCLRLRAAGQRIVCRNDVHLFHLEGASWSPEARRTVFRHNALRHQRMWGRQINEMLAGDAADRGPWGIGSIPSRADIVSQPYAGGNQG